MFSVARCIPWLQVLWLQMLNLHCCVFQVHMKLSHCVCFLAHGGLLLSGYWVNTAAAKGLPQQQPAINWLQDSDLPRAFGNWWCGWADSRGWPSARLVPAPPRIWLAHILCAPVWGCGCKYVPCLTAVLCFVFLWGRSTRQPTVSLTVILNILL